MELVKSYENSEFDLKSLIKKNEFDFFENDHCA